MGVAAILAVLLLPGSGRGPSDEASAAPRRSTVGASFCGRFLCCTTRAGQPYAAAARSCARGDLLCLLLWEDPARCCAGFVSVLATARRRVRRLVRAFQVAAALACGLSDLCERRSLASICAPLRPLFLKLRCLRRRLSCSQALNRRPGRYRRDTAQKRASAMDASPPASGAARALRSRATAATRSRRTRDAPNTMLQAAHRFALHRSPR